MLTYCPCYSEYHQMFWNVRGRFNTGFHNLDLNYFVDILPIFKLLLAMFHATLEVSQTWTK